MRSAAWELLWAAIQEEGEEDVDDNQNKPEAQEHPDPEAPVQWQYRSGKSKEGPNYGSSST